MAGDESAFAALVERHRRELHVHCYRMLGSFEEAEDLVQETFLRAWRRRDGFHGGPLFRAWLYKIATNACIDHSRHRVRSITSFADIPWLQPYPDRLLDQIASDGDEPEATIVTRETIELAFLAVIQLLPPKQRAVLILRDVLEWSAADTAEALELTVASANSALQRARATVKQNRPVRPVAEPSETERVLLRRLIDAHERADAESAIAMMREDIRITMPPLPMLYQGVAMVAPLLQEGLAGPGHWRLLPTRANRMPAAASYLRPHGETEFRAFKIDVLRVEDGLVAEITTFDHTLFPRFGLPPVYPEA
ncbi:RNA polymerase subunit sigma-70 [Sphaerisporangium album]|uniref:RNA polymerase sigma factor n=1 Tax=Sphaerisporangium album TaxID=509200 RepID=A0A367FHK7_9ACTN|nr:RNA polymerase subunit sigma-70 [Sphaerisporangium album]